MIDKIKELIAEAEEFKAQSKEEVEAFRIKYLGKKGLLNAYFAEFKNVANEQKKEFGQTINALKKTAEDKVNALKEELESKEEVKGVYGDLSRPGEPIEIGARHPISIVKNQIIDITLEPNSLFYMSQEVQKYWLHSILESNNENDERISMTLRKLIVQ